MSLPFDNTKYGLLYPNGLLMASLVWIEDPDNPGVYIPWDGAVDISFGASSVAINDGANDSIKASVLESTEEADVFGIVVVNPDGSNIGGGSGGGAVTIADGADVAEGATTDAKVVGDNAGTVSAKLRGLNYLLALVIDVVNTRINVFIQNATLAVTQSGSWVLSAGSAIIGNVRIDQTTPGTTNGVVVNSSALPSNAAQETGGNLAAAATSLAILDDWDESDRAKVNLIAGQAGIAGGTGTDGATVPRVTLATNVALPAGTNAIGGVTGTVADDSTTPGAPVTIGGLAKSPDGTDPGNVSAEDDVARFISDLNRIQFVNNTDPTAKCATFNGSSAYTDQEFAADPGANYQIVVKRVRISNGAATALNMFIEDTAGSTKRGGPYYLPAQIGGVVFDCNIPLTPSEAGTFTTSDSHLQTVEIEYIVKRV